MVSSTINPDLRARELRRLNRLAESASPVAGKAHFGQFLIELDEVREKGVSSSGPGFEPCLAKLAVPRVGPVAVTLGRTSRTRLDGNTANVNVSAS